MHAEIALHGMRLLRHKGPKYDDLSTPIHELTSWLRTLKENKTYGPFMQVVARQLRKPALASRASLRSSSACTMPVFARLNRQYAEEPGTSVT